MKFNASGTRLWATYYGGYGFQENSSVATDGQGNVYLAGRTGGSSDIAAGGHQNNFGGGDLDAYLVKFNASGARQWATYYGGLRNDLGFAVATDGSGNVYLAGITGSENNIAAAGHQMAFGGGAFAGDAFLAKFNPAGVRQWGTYYGGTSNEQSGRVAVDAEGYVYLAGTTASMDNIASGGFQNALRGSTDLFLARFDPAGARQWGTYYGAVPDDLALAVAAGPSGDIYVSGYTESYSNFATGGFQNTYGGGAWDAFLVKVEGDAISGSPVLDLFAPKINTYPNPVKDVLQVVVANPSLSTCTLQLHSAEGRLLREQEIAAPGGEWTAELDMQGLSAGVYVLTVRSAAGSASSKVIRE
ncbi:MAG: SBBP repeat-containing protein [Phaeodactylibacter sp.]|nr:SBBP repeat-containing protein [Phaeodactylibacter sp.]